MALASGDRAQQIEHMLGECEDFIGRLSQWEQNFVESLRNQFDMRGTLTEKQVETLERIYCEKVP